MSQLTQPPADHRVKVAHLVFGLLFLGVAGVWALIAGGFVTANGVTVLGPAVLITAGVLGLLASLASSRNRTRSAQRPPNEQADLHDDTTEEIR